VKTATDDRWRPFEPSRDELERIERERTANTCNHHNDCSAADEACKAKGGRIATERGPFYGQRVDFAFHCDVEDCEDCFGC
jgi:hypothetical protein